VAAVRELISRSPASQHLYVNNKGKPLSRDFVGKRISEVMRAAGYDAQFRPHSLRGIGSSRALQAGIPSPLVYLQFRFSSNSVVFPLHYCRSPVVNTLGEAIYGIKDGVLR